MPDLNDIWTPSRRFWRPSPRRPLQEWCDASLTLPAVSGYQAGPWRTSAFPHQRGVFYALHHPRVEEVTLCWGTRLGKTAIGQAWLAWAAKNDPGPAMIATSVATSAREFADVRLYPLLEACHETADLLLPEHKRAFPRVDLRQMLIYFAWSGGKTTLGERSIRYMYLTELDKWDTSTSTEADPEQLALERTKDWPNRKILRESTPTQEGSSRIWRALKNSELILYYHVPCPHCHKFRPLVFENIKWTKAGEHSTPQEAFETAYYQCPACRGKIEDHHRPGMFRHGVWAAENDEVQDDRLLVKWARVPRRVGMHLSSLYSPTLSWGEIAEKFVMSNRDNDPQNFVNSWLALPWKAAIDRPEWQKVRERLADPLPRGTVPEWCTYLTAGIDCHSPRQRGNIYAILACGRGGRTHLVEVGEVRGELRDSVADQIRMSAEAVLESSWLTEDNRTVNVNLACIDSGGTWTHDVYQECYKRGARLRAIKGSAGPSAAGKAWESRPAQTDPRTGKAPPVGLMFCLLNTNFWKGFVLSKLTQAERSDSALTFHASMDDITAQQICNVYMAQRTNHRGLQINEFCIADQAVGDHAHDALCYAMAAADMLPGHILFQRPEQSRAKIKPKIVEDPHPGRFGFKSRTGGGFVRRR